MTKSEETNHESFLNKEASVWSRLESTGKIAQINLDKTVNELAPSNAR
jgi:hypothetical protein